MRRRERVRVEFGLSADLADRVYRYAERQGLSLSQTGERLLDQALAVIDDRPAPLSDQTVSPDSSPPNGS